ncbi:hypothetical protein OG896_36125 [Streptomyces sp. NBC_00669]|uniref:hypothetical protein n=1 Tax=Streptomyces sp. NBC_00669 TaxID=2976011 RepID=UPI002E31008B|nr:hypothetical protein [Streptomyces sp. NBC_00669]
MLIDLDGFALAPREWDLVLTAVYYDRYGWHTREQYESFVHHYGFDLMNWPGYPVLADVRELTMTPWMGGKAAAESRAAEEFVRRVEPIGRTAAGATGPCSEAADGEGWMLPMTVQWSGLSG